MNQPLIETIGRRLAVLFLIGTILLMLPGCGSDHKGEAWENTTPDLSGGLIRKAQWETSDRGQDWTASIGQYHNLTLKVFHFKNYSKEETRDYISNRIFVLRSLYRESYSPYPGRISNLLGCADEFKPLEVDNRPFNYHLTYATSRFTYGACAWDIITYRGIFFFIYCEDKESLYQIELFVPKEEYSAEYEESLKSLHCPS